MEKLWEQVMKFLAFLAILLGSGEFSGLVREALKAKLGKQFREWKEKVKP